MTEEQATIEINELTFPAVQEGDIANHEGYSFIYQSGEWVIKPE